MKAKRWVYLVVGTIAMLFAGVIYTWSVLKMPLGQEFGWSNSQLTVNFTLTMVFFCVGGIIGSLISKKLGVTLTVIIAAILGGGGFVVTSFALSGTAIAALYIFYGIISGIGIGIAYNVLVSTINAWFPDKKGLCSGILMMGFGASTLIIGNVSNSLFGIIGWRTTFMILGIAIGVILIIAGLIIRAPKPEEIPAVPQKQAANSAARDYTVKEMVKTSVFWRVFILLVFLTAVGNVVASVAKDMTIGAGGSDSLATTMVGMFAVCNGLSRIIIGFLFDSLGRRKSMIISSILAIIASGFCILTPITQSLPICIVALCLSGATLGTCPTGTAVATRMFFGDKYFPTNLSICSCNLLVASLIATLCSVIAEKTGGYLIPFIILMALSLIGLVINLTIKDVKKEK
ncbi:MAG: MFS transporter [Lachnospiraceae bacterium]|nr:MFS transporter [Lachnospiraceae bacterium]